MPLISRICQAEQSCISAPDLDAEGTKAAAATAVTMDVSAAAMEQNIKRVYLDRPFAYAIIETDTGLPVFMGTVCDPSAK